MSDLARDRELMGRVAAGDRAAFAELMTEHQDRVFAVCLRTLGDREGALDATQDTFVTLWRKASQFEGKAAVGTWLYRIAVNTCYDQLRRRRRRPTEPMPDHFEPADPLAADPFDAAESRPDLERALRSIPEEFRAAVVLADVEGFSMAEAAEILQVPEGTVKSRVFRGRRHLARLLGNPEGVQSRPTDDHHA